MKLTDSVFLNFSQNAAIDREFAIWRLEVKVYKNLI